MAVLNYPNEHSYTRVTGFKHLTGQEHNKTPMVYEYPCSEGDPYYPIPRKENAAPYAQYKKLAQSTPYVYFAGRLGTYRYYNMDQVTPCPVRCCPSWKRRKRKENMPADGNQLAMIL